MIPIPPALAAWAAKESIQKIAGIAKWAVPLIALVAIGIYIAVLKGDVRSLTKQRNNLREWQADTVSVVRSEIPVERRAALTPSGTADEIRWLGRELRTSSEALRLQSARLVEAKDKAQAAQNGVTEALRGAAQRDKGRAALRVRLTDPKRSTGLTADEWGKL
jgi:hypothetical protein